MNAYLREISDDDFTAKDFRTWAGTLLAAHSLDERAEFESVTAGKAACVSTVIEVAHRLGNTPAICRKCYIHPAVLAAFQDEKGFALWKRHSADSAQAGLSPQESALLGFLAASGS